MKSLKGYSRGGVWLGGVQLAVKEVPGSINTQQQKPYRFQYPINNFAV